MAATSLQMGTSFASVESAQHTQLPELACHATSLGWGVRAEAFQRDMALLQGLYIPGMNPILDTVQSLQGICCDVDAALKLYTAKRMLVGEGVTIPSQIRCKSHTS